WSHTPVPVVSLSLSCFFFSSRRRHTRSYGDWSSDVCSSDLNDLAVLAAHDPGLGTCGKDGQIVPVGVGLPTVRIDGVTVGGTGRSEERRVGKECRSGWSADQWKKETDTEGSERW